MMAGRPHQRWHTYVFLLSLLVLVDQSIGFAPPSLLGRLSRPRTSTSSTHCHRRTRSAGSMRATGEDTEENSHADGERGEESAADMAEFREQKAKAAASLKAASLRAAAARADSMRASQRFTGGLEDDDDDEEELAGMKEFRERKAAADRLEEAGLFPRSEDSAGSRQRGGGHRAAQLRAMFGGEGGVDEDGDELVELVGMAEFKAREAAIEKRDSPRAAAGWSNDIDDDDEGDELVGMEEFTVREAAEAGGKVDGGLGLEGGIFPSDMKSSNANSDEITLRSAKLDPGQPEALVGFWKLYGATGEREDISGQVILRADGQVIGGPTVRRTPGVTWSDPEGLRPVGGRWVVYKDEQTGQARIQFTIVLSFEKKQQLEMDGVVMAVDGWDETTGTAGIQLQIFGGVLKRSGGTETAKGQGDFSMMKMQTGEDKLIATVGSQQKRMW